MGPETTRRKFLAGAAGVTAAAATWRYADRALASDDGPFALGVASFDPLADRVIIWTRHVTIEPIRWEVALDNAFGAVVRNGTASTSAASDYTLHVDVDGLQPATTYWYRFRVGGFLSATGRTRTLPTPGAALDRMRVGVVTCTEWEFGFFGACRVVAERDDLDAVLSMGDYIYEFDRSYQGLPTPKPAGRRHDPAHETVSLDDYRQRYRQYKSDAGLQKMHASHPVIAMYDDHELANDWWKDGAQNHTQGAEGDFHARRDAALRAFREYVPIRANPVDATVVYRRFQFGDLVDLFMLDERRYRDQQPTNAVIGYFSVDPATDDPNRTMLGATQRDWLLNGLERSTAAWKVLGNPVPMAPVDVGPALAGALSTAAAGLGTALPPVPPPLQVESWDGYNGERQRILSTINDKQIKDVVVLTGDLHESMASDLPHDRSSYDFGANSAAVEFIAPAVTSPTLTETLQMATLPEALTINTVFEANLLLSNPWVKYHEGFRHGFGVAEFRADGMQYDFWFVHDRNRPDTGANVGSSWAVARGTAKATPAAAALGPRPPLGNRSTPQPAATIPATGGDQGVALALGAAAVAALAASRLTKPGEIRD